MGRFDDRATRPMRGPLDLLRWKLGAGAPRDRTRAPFRTPIAAGDPAIFASSDASLVWIGHASFVFRLGGLLVATDPIFSSTIAGTVRRLAPPGLALEVLPPIDVVTISHNHLDHMDLPTLRRIGPRALYVVPLGNGRWLRRLGFERVVELDWWEAHREAELEVTLVPARHWSMRAPWNRNEGLWGGFVYRSTEGTAYHAGDTAYFDGFAEIGRRLGPIDWAMLPIGAYEPRWFMEPQHMNPEEAGRAFLDLGAARLVAMHWGTFKLTDEPIGEPPERVRAFFHEQRIEDERLWIFAVGEGRRLGRVTAR